MLKKALQFVLMLSFVLGLVLMAGSYTGAVWGAGNRTSGSRGTMSALSLEERDRETRNMGIGAFMAIFGFGFLLMTIDQVAPPGQD